jgi:hypothetical protein
MSEKNTIFVVKVGCGGTADIDLHGAYRDEAKAIKIAASIARELSVIYDEESSPTETIFPTDDNEALYFWNKLCDDRRSSDYIDVISTLLE